MAIIRCFSIALVLTLFSVSTVQAEPFVLKEVPGAVYFSPSGNGQQAIVAQINQAKQTILVQAYSFTAEPIAKALLEAHKRGVKVQVILDKSQRSEKYTSATFMANSGIPTFIDDAHAIAHNKVMILDGETVITGSYNFTKAAEEKNAENLLILKSRELAKMYTENWHNHLKHSEPYSARN